MPRSNSGGKPNRNSGDTRKTDGKRDSNNHVSLGAQIPIHATLIGSNCCEALGITARGYAPVLELCRALVKAGHDPRRPLHAYRGDLLALKVRSIAPTSPTNPARHPAQRFEPQQNPCPMLTAVRGGAHDEQAQETI